MKRLREEEEEARSPSARHRAERNDNDSATHLRSGLEDADLPDAIESVPELLQLIDAFAMTISSAVDAAVERRDLSTLCTLLQREDAEGEWFDHAFALAARLGELEAVDAIARHDRSSKTGTYLGLDVVVPQIQGAMERGDRETVTHLWSKFYGDITPSEDDFLAGMLNGYNLVERAIKFGFPVILEALLFMEVTEADAEDPDGRHTFGTVNVDKLEDLLERAADLGDWKILAVFCEMFSEECFEWAVRNNDAAVLQATADLCPRETRVEACAGAIRDAASLELVQVLHGLCEPFSRIELEIVVGEAVQMARMDVLEWLQVVGTPPGAVAQMALMHADTYEGFRSIYELWGHLVSDGQIQHAFLRVVENGRCDIAAAISQQRSISASTLDRAMLGATEPSVIPFLCKRSISQYVLDDAFLSAAERNDFATVKIIYETGVTPTVYESTFIATCTNGLPIVKCFASMALIPKHLALEAARVATVRPVYEVFEYLYVQHKLSDNADELFSMAVDMQALSVVQMLLPETSRECAMRGYTRAHTDEDLQVHRFLSSSIQDIPDAIVRQVFICACRSNSSQIVANCVAHQAIYTKLVEREFTEAAHNRRDAVVISILQNRSISKDSIMRSLQVNPSKRLRQFLRDSDFFK